jgi:hypothetical protein
MFGFPIAGMDDQKLINQGPGQRRRADRNERRGAQPELATAEPLGRHDAIVSYWDLLRSIEFFSTVDFFPVDGDFLGSFEHIHRYLGAWVEPQ